MTHGPGGGVLDVGRRRRTVSPALRRALAHRDGGCRFPGCACRYCDAHHLRHWAKGGETRLRNLALLCRRHHRLVHEAGWRVERGADGELRFRRPDGRVLPEVPKRPRVAGDPVRALEREQPGLRINGWTATTRWIGDPLDVDWALGVLRRPALPDPPDVSAETPGAPGGDPTRESPHGPGARSAGGAA